MHKFTKALVAAALITATVSAVSPAYALDNNKGGGGKASCSLGSKVYAHGSVVGLLKCNNGTWELLVKIPDPPKMLFAY